MGDGHFRLIVGVGLGYWFYCSGGGGVWQGGDGVGWGVLTPTLTLPLRGRGFLGCWGCWLLGGIFYFPRISGGFGLGAGGAMFGGGDIHSSTSLG